MADLNLIPRLKLHDGKLIKDRRYHLRTYPNCFIARELIDWLVSHKEAPDRATAVGLMQHLMDHDIVHHGPREAQGQNSVQRVHSHLRVCTNKEKDLTVASSQCATRGWYSRTLNCCTASARTTARFPSTQRWKSSRTDDVCMNSKSCFCLCFKFQGWLRSVNLEVSIAPIQTNAH